MIAWNALIDVGTRAVLTISPRVPVVMFLRDCTLDSMHATGINLPNYSRSLFRTEGFFLARGNPAEYPRWAWSHQERTLTRLRDDVVSQYLIERSKLATAKARVIGEMMNAVSTMRASLQTGIDFQDSVYIVKRIQAQRFKDSGYDEEAALQAPYVLHYADLKAIPLKQAADEILFRAQLTDERLSKTDVVRMKYFDMIKQAKTPEEIPDIHFRFRNEAFGVLDA